MRVSVYFFGLIVVVVMFSAYADKLENALTLDAGIFMKAVRGDTSAVEDALKLYDGFDKAFPNHPLVKVRKGSLMAMQARTAWMPWTRLRYAENGLDEIDLALKNLRPQHKTVLHEGVSIYNLVNLTAAITFASVPKFMNRFGQSRRIFKTIVEDKQFSDSPKKFKTMVWYHRGLLAKKENKLSEYRNYLQQAIKIDSTGYYGKQAALEIPE